MSRRKRHAQETSKGPAAPPAIREPLPGAELFRRYLLGLVTALIVARPLVFGEDPGMLSRFTDTSNLLITLLWLVAATGWAIWHNIAGKGEWYVGIVEAGLLAAVIAVFLRIPSAPYRLPAILFGWEWLAMFLALFVVRQLATKEGDQRRLLAAMLGSAVALSVLAMNTAITGQVSDRPAKLAPPTPRLMPIAAMIYGPTPQSVAGAGVVCWYIDREDEFEAPWPAERRLADEPDPGRGVTGPYEGPDNFAGFLVLTVPALAVAAVLRWKQRSEGGTALFCLTVLAVLVVMAALWFTRSSAAILGLLISGGAVGFAGYLLLARLQGSTPTEPPAETEPEQGTRWEFYFGGMTGLLLGYFLREMSESPDRILESASTAADDMMGRGIIGGFRAVLWFAAFAVFEDVPWTRRLRSLALTIGVGALVGTLVAADAVGLPSVAEMLWIGVALALAVTCSRSRKWLPANWFLRAIPIVILLGLTITYVNTIFYPVTSGSWAAGAAMRAARPQLEQRQPRSGALPGKSNDFEKEVIDPLLAANQVEGEQNAHRNVQLARWYGELLHMDRNLPVRRENLRMRAIDHAEQAIALDPRSPDGYLVRYWLARRIARVFPGETKTQNQKAAEVLSPLIEIDPGNPRWHYLRARALFDAGDHVGARSAAEEALDLQRVTNAPKRRLTSWEQLHAETWLMARPHN